MFLPGAYEINKVAGLLSKCLSQGNESHAYSMAKVDIHCLYSELNKQKQDAALRPSQSGRRKIILATNIAETSLTIEGIRIVVDSGKRRRGCLMGPDAYRTADLARALTDLGHLVEDRGNLSSGAFEASYHPKLYALEETIA